MKEYAIELTIPKSNITSALKALEKLAEAQDLETPEHKDSLSQLLGSMFYGGGGITLPDTGDFFLGETLLEEDLYVPLQKLMETLTPFVNGEIAEKEVDEGLDFEAYFYKFDQGVCKRYYAALAPIMESEEILFSDKSPQL